MKLLIPLDVDRIENHKIAMCDVVWLIDEYLDYLVEHFDHASSDTIERLVVSYSDALWRTILDKTLVIVPDKPSLVRKCWNWIRGFMQDLRDMWEEGE